jgi:Uma2 family endonuclease
VPLEAGVADPGELLQGRLRRRPGLHHLGELLVEDRVELLDGWVTPKMPRNRASHPLPADIALLVEVADSSLNRDRTEKGRLYAAAGIPVYWIINLVEGPVEVYTGPSGPGPNAGYLQRQDYGPQDDVPLQIGGQAGPVPGAELLL